MKAASRRSQQPALWITLAVVALVTTLMAIGVCQVWGWYFRSPAASDLTTGYETRTIPVTVEYKFSAVGLVSDSGARYDYYVGRPDRLPPLRSALPIAVYEARQPGRTYWVWAYREPGLYDDWTVFQVVAPEVTPCAYPTRVPGEGR